MQKKYNESRRWMMLIAIVVIHCSLFMSEVQAQPKQRRNQQQTQAQQKGQNTTQGGMTQRARLMYPVAADMPEDVVWRRDIYREVDLNQDINGSLYAPIQPKGKQMNLFTYIFKLAQNGYIPIYEYSPTESEERFEESAKRPFKDMLDDQGIFYEEKEGKVVVDNSDIPSEEVRRYFLKESAYYDQTTSSFHRKVIALCPVRMSAFPVDPNAANSGDGGDDDGDDFSFGGGDFGDEPPRPMFWVKYSDLEPFLNRQSIMTSDYNVVPSMTMEDFFTLNKYSGKIYKVTNMLGRNLADYCKTDSALAKEQARIEAELEGFRKNIFGNPEKKDSLDAAADAATSSKKSKSEKAGRSSEPKTKTEKVKRAKSSSSKSSGGGSRVSVRRERH
jgi:gliding motility associated protien GldN